MIQKGFSFTINPLISQENNLKTGLDFWREKKYEEAFPYFQKESKNGNSLAQYFLGYMYLFGYGISKNISLGLDYIKMSSKNENLNAKFLLGLIYYEGSEITKNNFKAYKLLKKCAKEGHSEAQNFIGCMHYYGEGVEENIFKAIKWYKISSKNNNSDAQFNLGNSYLKASIISKKYLKNASLWFEKSAQSGNSDAQNNIANMYRFGYGIEQNISKAIYYYKLSINQGHILAHLNLGSLYFEQISNKKEKGIELLKIAAKNGNIQALYMIKNKNNQKNCDLI